MTGWSGTAGATRRFPDVRPSSILAHWRALDRVDQSALLLLLCAFYLPVSMPGHIIVNHLTDTVWSWWTVFLKAEVVVLLASAGLLVSSADGRALIGRAWSGDRGFRWLVWLGAGVAGWTTLSAIVQGAYAGYWGRSVLMTWVMPGLFALLVVALRPRGWLPRVWTAMAAGSAIVVSVAFVLYFVSFGVPQSFPDMVWTIRTGRVWDGFHGGIYFGELTLGGFNDIAGYCATSFGALLGSAYAWSAWKPALRRAALAFVVLLLALSFFTYSRGAILTMGALVGLALAPMLVERRWPPRSVLAVCAAFVLFGVCVLLPPSAIPYWRGQLTATEGSSASFRLHLWSKAFDAPDVTSEKFRDQGSEDVITQALEKVIEQSRPRAARSTSSSRAQRTPPRPEDVRKAADDMRKQVAARVASPVRRTMVGYGTGNYGIAQGMTYDAGTHNVFLDAFVNAGVPAVAFFCGFWLLALARSAFPVIDAVRRGVSLGRGDIPPMTPFLAIASMTVLGVLVSVRLDNLGTMLHATVLWLVVASTGSQNLNRFGR